MSMNVGSGAALAAIPHRNIDTLRALGRAAILARLNATPAEKN